MGIYNENKKLQYPLESKDNVGGIMVQIKGWASDDS